MEVLSSHIILYQTHTEFRFFVSCRKRNIIIGLHCETKYFSRSGLTCWKRTFSNHLLTWNIIQAKYAEKNFISISSHIEWDMIVGAVFLSILNRMESHSVQNRKGNCHHDHIPFNLKVNRNIAFPMHRA